MAHNGSPFGASPGEQSWRHFVAGLSLKGRFVVFIVFALTAIGFVNVVTRATRSLPFFSRASSWAQGYWLAHPSEQPIIAIELCSMILAIIGLVVGCVAILYARRHDKDMVEVAESIQTRFIGRFPEHISLISDLIRNAQSGQVFDILSDCADYGSFFAPLLHEKVHEAIINACDRGVRIRYLATGPLHHVTQNSPFYTFDFSDLMGDDDSAAPQAIRGEFQQHLAIYLRHLRDRGFGKWLHSLRADDLKVWIDAARPNEERVELIKLAGWVESCKTICTSEHGVLEKSQRDEYRTLLWCREKQFEDQLKLKIGVDFCREAKKSENPLLFWVNRNREAVFMPVYEAEKTRGLGFRTQDRFLLDVFQGTFDNRWKPCAQPAPLAGKAEWPSWHTLSASFDRLRRFFKR